MRIFREGKGGIRSIDVAPSVVLVEPATPLGRRLGVSDRLVKIVGQEQAVAIPEWDAPLARRERFLRSILKWPDVYNI